MIHGKLNGAAVVGSYDGRFSSHRLGYCFKSLRTGAGSMNFGMYFPNVQLRFRRNIDFSYKDCTDLNECKTNLEGEKGREQCSAKNAEE